MSSIAFERISFHSKNPLPKWVERHSPTVTLLGIDEDGNLSAHVGFWSPGMGIPPQEVTLIPETKELRAQLKHLEHIQGDQCCRRHLHLPLDYPTHRLTLTTEDERKTPHHARNYHLPR